MRRAEVIKKQLCKERGNMRETGGIETKSAASQTAEPFYISEHITLPL